MSKYENYENNLLYKIAMYILEYIVISFFVIVTSVCSLGILFYSSISSGYYYYYQKELHQEHLNFKRLLLGIKKSYKQSIPLGLLQLFFVFVGYVTFNNLAFFNGNMFVYYTFIIAITIIIIHNFYTLQLTTYFEVKLIRALGLSTYFMVMYFLSTVTIVVLLIALILSVSINPAVIIIIVGLFIHVSSKIFMMIFTKHSPEEVKEDEEN